MIIEVDMIGQEPQHRTTLQEENVNNAGQDMISVMETTNCKKNYDAEK